MATTTEESQQPLKLGHFLQKNQEPFVLEVFLSERGKMVKPVNSRKRNRISNCLKVLRAAYEKIVPINKSFNGKDGNFRNFQEQDVVEEEEPSRTSDNVQFLELFDGGVNEIETEGNFQYKRMDEESKQHSPVSVLEKALNYETEDSISLNSASSSLESRELEELLCVHPPSQYLLSRKVLHQTRQLLFDCVRELVETHEKREKRRSASNEVLATEELRQLILQKIKGWGKQSGDISNITQLLDSDFIHSKFEWSDFQSERRDVGVDVADAILGEIIREIVIDLKSM